MLFSDVVPISTNNNQSFFKKKIKKKKCNLKFKNIYSFFQLFMFFFNNFIQLIVFCWIENVDMIANRQFSLFTSLQLNSFIVEKFKNFKFFFTFCTRLTNSRSKRSLICASLTWISKTTKKPSCDQDGWHTQHTNKWTS